MTTHDTTDHVSDEELLHIYREAERASLNADNPKRGHYTRADAFAGIRAVRAALAQAPVVPQIPEGWRLHGISSVAGHTDEHGFGVVGYNAYLRQNIFSNDPQVSGFGPTWLDALAAAIAAAEGERA